MFETRVVFLKPIKVLPVIMSGGAGTRLWPLSNGDMPKQFHQLGGARPMIEETVLRFRGAYGRLQFLPPVVIASAAHRTSVRDAMTNCGMNPSAIVLEPMGRNTAPAAVIASLIAQEVDPEAYVLLTPADHLVSNLAAFLQVIEQATAALPERIVTFGITPSGPETGYGYIKQGQAIAPGVFSVAAFKEKPDSALASRYLRKGGFSWNAGVFLFSPEAMLREFGAFADDIRQTSITAFLRASRQDNEVLLDAEAFAVVRSEAVDRAVMEHTKLAAVAPCDIGWADVGSWAELWRLSPKDTVGNATEGPVTLVDTMNSYVRSAGIQLSVLGVSDLVIVANGSSVLVAHRNRVQDVKAVIPRSG